jgi:hypothetical protein
MTEAPDVFRIIACQPLMKKLLPGKSAYRWYEEGELEGVTPETHLHAGVYQRRALLMERSDSNLRIAAHTGRRAAAAAIRQIPVASITSSKPMRFVEETVLARPH